jgi:uncharacterized membrane protein
MDAVRLCRHLLATRGRAKTLFAQATMLRMQEAIVRGEALHRGDVRLIIETAMPLRKVWRGMTTRQRALDLFGTFRVWDTEEQNGVLFYVNLADRALEVIADRAASRGTGDQHWLFACQLAQESFRQGEFEAGIVAALDAIDRAIAAAFPARAQQAAAVPDRGAAERLRSGL